MSDHNHLEPEWEFTTECDVRDEPASIRADHVTLLSNLGLLDSWNQTSPSLNSGDLSLGDYFPDIFFQTSLPAITSTTSSFREHEHPTRVLEYGDSSMSKRIKVVDEIPQLVRTQSQDIEGGRPRESEREQLERTRPKRTRSSEIHNITERRRRSRINEKIQALGYLIPNFKKTDKASILDEAIVYIKALKLQAEMMSMGRGRLYMSPAGYQQLPYFSPYLPLRPGLHGVGVGFEMGYPMFPLSSATFHPSVLPPAATSFPPIPGSAALPVSQAQIPSQLPETFAGTISLPASVSGRATAFKQPYQFGESSSQNIQRLLSTNSQSVPIISQDSTQFGTSNTVPATHIIPPPNVRDILAAEAPQYEEEAGNGKSG